MEQELPATTLVIFGASGDLSRRYLLPSLAEVCQSSAIKAHLQILGVSRRQLALSEILPGSAASLADNFALIALDYSKAADFQILKSKLKAMGSKQVIFYLAVPPAAVLGVIGGLAKAKLNGPGYKLLLEKPFGSDLASAKKLIKQTSRCFDESQIYRIDHYLAKEMAQNIAVFLGGNAVFREVWHGKYIDKIDFIVSEQIGIEGRSSFYEQTGALRDIVQSHLMQLVAITLMRPCEDFSEFELMPSRRLEALRRLSVVPGSVARAQYSGYRRDAGNPDSQVETFVRLELRSSDRRWQGVPLQLVTGKNLDRKYTEIRVHFKRVNGARPNMLVLRIQPKEGVEFDLWVKQPGPVRRVQKLPFSFNYQDHFQRLPEAYEQVLIDAISSNHSLFAGSGEVLASWKTLQPVLDDFQAGRPKLKTYRPGASVEQILQNT